MTLASISANDETSYGNKDVYLWNILIQREFKSDQLENGANRYFDALLELQNIVLTF